MVAATNTGIRSRSEIDTQYKWNAESVYTDRAAWETAADELKAKIPNMAQFRGKLNESPALLADFLDVYDDIFRQVANLNFYARMSVAVDSNDKEATAMADKAQGLYAQAAGGGAFLNPELIAIGKETLLKWIKDKPRLSIYGQYVDNLFRREKHVRSAEVEQVLGMVSDPLRAAHSISDKLTNQDMKFPKAKDSAGNEYEVTQSTVETMYDSPDRELRRTAYQSYRSTYLDFKNTLTANYIASVKQDVFFSRVRGYESSLEASLFENNIPTAVFNNLIETYKKNIPTWHKYWAVRRKALGYDELYPYDIWAPISKNPPHVPFEQSVQWISEGMQPLGDAYVAALKKGCLQDRWVDVYPNKGKSDGAFSYGTHDTHPFIMMSYDDTLGAMSTLAHELGHSMHSYFSRKNQPRVYSNYSLFVAEVASNFNQAMTRAYLRKTNDDPQFQIALIEEAMGNLHRYFFIMPTLARFELEVHRRVEAGQGQNADDLIDLMTELFQEGYGSEMVVDHDLVGITWATFGHLYAAYYVYQYATGISAAHALAAKIQKEGEPAAQRYLEFLSAGSSLYPLDALNHAGVDMTKPDAVETTFAVLADMVDRLAELTGVAV